MTIPSGPLRAINLLPLKASATIGEFSRFSAGLDQPTLLAQEMVESFDVYAVAHRSPGAPRFDIVEVMSVRDWAEWERVRDNDHNLAPMMREFDRQVDAAGVRTLFCTTITPQR